MIHVLDVINALSAKLVALWPDRMSYVDVCPQDFQRPSHWLQVTKNDIRRTGRTELTRSMDVTLVLFDRLDDHYEASWERLAADADHAAEVLMQPLQVGERTLLASLRSEPRDPDRQVLHILLDFRDVLQAESCTTPTDPLMQRIDLARQITSFPDTPHAQYPKT